ncbi:hypothetical protein ACIHFD_49150 [Nonomuraea sp. NPDC051941]|uniref:hypothetical protein n=1 Tax=Nonomuraea sp. NPDC051941 TaxID=3364373 RepID=UPI0037C68E0B
MTYAPYAGYFNDLPKEFGFTGPTISDDDYEVHVYTRDTIHVAINVTTGKTTIAEVDESDEPAAWATEWNVCYPALTNGARALWPVRLPIATTPPDVTYGVIAAALAHIDEKKRATTMLALVRDNA